jgi:uncharacterized membrane protein
MGKGRLEAFSDGVIAIIITIMVLELKVPHSADLSALWELAPVFLSYVLSFANVGIYWNNHHHLLHTVKQVSAGILWANLHLLFWLSLFPFTTGWMGENHFSTWPVVIYGFNLLLAALAYTILVQMIIRKQGHDSLVAKAIGSDFKSYVSLAAYVAAVVLAFFNSWISGGLFVAVAMMWFIPDRRIERVIDPAN